MGIARRIGGILSWVLAVIGVLAGALWLATTAGLMQPLIVVSGSMQPGIRVGDLLIATPVAAGDVRVGEVVSLPNPQTGTLVTHRVLEVSRDADGYAFTMQGDANDAVDPLPYLVAAGAPVWHPTLTLPGVGVVVDRIARPSVAIPLLVTVGALMLFTALPGGSRRADADADADEAETDPRGASGPPPEPQRVPRAAPPDDSAPAVGPPGVAPPGTAPPGDEAARPGEGVRA